MGVKIIFPSSLQKWAEIHPTAAPSLESWRVAISGALWNQPSDIKKTWARYSYIKTNIDTDGHDRIVFDIGGNNYRLVAHVSYDEHRTQKSPEFHGAVFLRWFGPHSEYDKVDFTTSKEANYE